MAKRRSEPLADADAARALRHPPDDRGLPLESLTTAFAEMINRGQDPYAAADASGKLSPKSTGPKLHGAAGTAKGVATEGGASEDTASENTLPIADQIAAGADVSVSAEEPVDQPVDGPDLNPRSIVEAMLFVGHPKNEPLTSQRIAGLMRGVRPAEIDELVRELNSQYQQRGCPYSIRSEGAGYRLVVDDEHAGLRQRLAGRTREARLSQAAIEVLALVAYNGAISSEQISAIRGRSSGGILTQLVRRQLLRIQRSPENRREANYSTTERFLQLFGLESLADLPRGQEVEQR